MADLAEADRDFEIPKQPNTNNEPSTVTTTTSPCDLLEALDNVKTQGSFASFHPLKRVDPELFVHDVGPIGLPLQEPQIRQVIDKAIQAPFGKGSKTIIDTTVRNTWELDPKQFELRSPRWGSDLQRICAIVASDHAGQTKTFKTSKVDQSFACWYSDVQHEVLPIMHGYRVVLTYNLTIDQTAERPSAGLLRSETRMLRHTLRRWLRTGAESEEVSHVYYGLDHEYTEANVSLKTLKGRDLAVVQTLQELASELEFDVLLALTEKMEMGSAEPHGYDPSYDTYKPSRRQREEDELAPHEIDEVYDRQLTVKVLVDLSGRPIIRNMALEQDNCLQADDFFEGVGRREEFKGFTGNSGATATHWYRVTAVLIIRRDSIAQFLVESLELGSYHSDASTTLLMNYLADPILKGALNRESAFSTLKDVWMRASALAITARRKMDVKTVSKMLQAAIQLEQWEFFENTAKNVRGNLPAEYYTWLREQVVEGKAPFDKVKTGYVPSEPVAWEDRVNHEPDILLLNMLTSTGFPLCTYRKTIPSRRRAHSFYNVVPLIEDQFIMPAFTLEFLSTLFSYARGKKFPVKEALELYKRVVKDFVAKLDFGKVHGTKTEEQTPKAPRRSYGQTAPESTTVTHNNLAVAPTSLLNLFFDLIKLSRPPHEDLVMPLAMKLVGFAPKMQPADFNPLWIPFLQQLVAVLEKTMIPLTIPRYQQIFGAVLESYCDNYVGQKQVTQAPALHGDMHVHARSRCACHHCCTLNRFLENPGEYVCRFSVDKRTRMRTETLVVTKFREMEERKYAEKQKEAAERFQEFDQTKLGLLLGEDYPAIAQGLWKRPVNLVSGRWGATHIPAADPSQSETVPELKTGRRHACCSITNQCASAFQFFDHCLLGSPKQGLCAGESKPSVATFAEWWEYNTGDRSTGSSSATNSCSAEDCQTESGARGDQSGLDSASLFCRIPSKLSSLHGSFQDDQREGEVVGYITKLERGGSNRGGLGMLPRNVLVNTATLA
ncbi:putative 2OG-Fe(II)oxygenase superfamily protein [Colletotrichum sublineola]|uniref:Putative 2OG-Fe(II)oxygenase superfamily protein n=1 Tax=Colletotrichum sublineola TaxID=1173701 RepID=A0A066X3T8_COLSU|nr:putative 2OG-Fe(II)oxygenase superfamily protein [Colletotrichum sublineola]